MRRYWVDPETLTTGSRIELSGEVFHHICRVCRHEKGELIELLGRPGRALRVRLVDIGKNHAAGEVEDERVIAPLPRPFLTLCLSVPRFPIMEAVIEKAVELGVFRLRPFFSDYSHIGDPAKISDSRWERWQKIIRAATEQTGRGEQMYLERAVALKDLLFSFNRQERTSGLLAYEGRGDMDVRTALQESLAPDRDEVWLFVGSEGGFSTSEVETLRANGLPPLSLGEQVLRVETACVALLSVIKYECGHFSRRSRGLD